MKMKKIAPVLEPRKSNCDHPGYGLRVATTQVRTWDLRPGDGLLITYEGHSTTAVVVATERATGGYATLILDGERHAHRKVVKVSLDTSLWWTAVRAEQWARNRVPGHFHEYDHIRTGVGVTACRRPLAIRPGQDLSQGWDAILQPLAEGQEVHGKEMCRYCVVALAHAIWHTMCCR